MPRWIVFDQGTALKLRARFPQAAVFEAPGRAALEYALESSASVVAVLPAGFGSQPAIAVFRPPRVQPTLPTEPPTKGRSVRATGFLGLNDESIFEEEVPAQKTKWWKFWAD